MSQPPEPIVIVGGFLSAAGDYRRWERILAGPPFRRRTFVADIGRGVWATTSDETFRPQITAINNIVGLARQATGAGKVWLVCHSAGGRVARLWMGEQPYGGSRCGGYRNVRGVIFLGSPYRTEEPWARRSTFFANTNYPGAFYPDITYVSVIGRSVFGRRSGSLEQRLAYQSYRSVDPRNPEQWGDGVITVPAAQVPGATNYTLEGIYHLSVLGRPGYMAPPALKVWGQHLLNQE